jgi:hypothetical protein
MCQTWRRPGSDPGLDPAQTGAARFRPYRCSYRHTGTLTVPGVAAAPLMPNACRTSLHRAAASTAKLLRRQEASIL